MSRTAPKIDNRFETNGYEMTEGEAKAAVEDHLYIFKSGISPGAACTFASAKSGAPDFDREPAKCRRCGSRDPKTPTLPT